MKRNALASLLRRIAVVACFNSIAAISGASTLTTDITDMWWNPNEDGWGVNITLQNDTAFLTFFLYDTSRRPTWYTAIAYYQGSGGGSFVWSGTLYATTGPYFGGPYSPYTARAAGTATFTATSISSGVLSYSVDGVPVTKNVVRQTWKNENYSGSYLGGFSLRFSNCSPSSFNGRQYDAGPITVSHNGTAFSATINGSLASCSFSGTYSQGGKLGQVTGNYSCNDGARGSFALYEITGTISGFNGRMTGQNQYCSWSGYFGGITQAP